MCACAPNLCTCIHSQDRTAFNLFLRLHVLIPRVSLNLGERDDGGDGINSITLL